MTAELERKLNEAISPNDGVKCFREMLSRRTKSGAYL